MLEFLSLHLCNFLIKEEIPLIWVGKINASVFTAIWSCVSNLATLYNQLALNIKKLPLLDEKFLLVTRTFCLNNSFYDWTNNNIGNNDTIIQNELNVYKIEGLSSIVKCINQKKLLNHN